MASSTARPHRQARSGVSYRDPSYDYEGEPFCRRSRSSSSLAIAKSGEDPHQAAKKNLALKPAKDRANAKERAEAVQLQRAISRSLSHKRSSETNVHLQGADHESSPDYRATNVALPGFSHEKVVGESMDELALKALFSDEILPMNCVDETACNDCLAFQCLLDVATEAALKSTLHAGESQDLEHTHFLEQNENNQDSEPSCGILQVETLQNKEMINKITSNEMDEQIGKCKDNDPQDKEKGQTNVRDEGSSDSSSEWGEGSRNQADTENENSDLSDESEFQLCRPVRFPQNALKNAVKDNVFPVQGKKARSARPILKSKALSSKNCQTLVSTPCKLLVKASGGKENILTSTSMGITKNTQASNRREQLAAKIGAADKRDHYIEKSKSSQMHTSRGFDLSPAEQQGICSVPLQSSALVHRRVIGLSRRHRPPPLHPYLVNTDS